MKHKKLVSNRTVEKGKTTVKQQPPLDEEAPIYGIKENKNTQSLQEKTSNVQEVLYGIKEEHRAWIESLRISNPAMYARIRSMD